MPVPVVATSALACPSATIAGFHATARKIVTIAEALDLQHRDRARYSSPPSSG